MATILDEGSGPLSIAVYAVVGAVAVGTVCYKLVDQPWRIVSTGLRDWAHRF